MGAAAATAGVLALDALPINAADAVGIQPVSGTVDFGATLARTKPTAVGICCTTFGATPVARGAEVQAANEARLDARYVRVPVAFRNGWISSAAGGNTGSVDGRKLVNWYRNHGMRVLAVVGGRTNDVDFARNDIETIMRGLGMAGVDYSAPNEPGLRGWSLANQVEAAKFMWSVGSKYQKDFRVWGPTWANYAPTEIAGFARAFANSRDRDKFAGITYHHYAMGGYSLKTTASMRSTSLYRDEIRSIRGLLDSLELPQNVNVDELNYSWRYRDGTPPHGRNDRFYTSVNTVWCALALGTIMASGGTGMVFGTQNGPLGLTVEKGNGDRGRTPGTPMPSYWGVASWTGAHMFPHFKDVMYKTASADPDVALFAVNNEAGGQNILCINQSPTRPKRLALDLKHARRGKYDVFQTRPDRPFDAFARPVKRQPYTNSVALRLPPMSVSVVVLRPR